MRQFYIKEIEDSMVGYYKSLPENRRRQYAGVECKKLGYGGKSYIAKLFQMSPNTLGKGLKEIENPATYLEIPIGRIRKVGGGRNFFFTTYLLKKTD